MSIREVIAVPIALASLLFLILAFAFPFLILDQSKEEAHDLSELRRVQLYLDQNLLTRNSLPEDSQIRRWAKLRKLELAPSVSTTPLGCLNDFKKAPRDQYVVGFWAGEWSECLSSPSGISTLQPNFFALLKSGIGDLIIYLALAIGLGWVAWTLGLRSRPNGT